MSIQIGKLLANGTVRHIKVTNEELSERFIRVLKRFYPNDQRVDALLELGDIHRLGPSPYGRWTDCRDEIHCFGAIRDGRRDNTHLPRIADSVELFKSYAEDCFLFADGRWYYLSDVERIPIEDYFIKPVKNTICNLAVYHNEKSSLYATPRMRSWQEIEEYAEREGKILYIFNGRRLVRIIKPSTFKEDKYV